MGAELTRDLLALCAGHGQLLLRGRGAQLRAVLELRRLESEKTFLDHQLRRLRKLHDGPLKAAIDRQGGSGFYDVLRLRAASEQFQRGYELLYPQDLRCWREELIELAGDPALALLWLDHGQFRSQLSAVIRPPWRTEELLAWCGVLNHLKLPCAPLVHPRSGEINGLSIGASGLDGLMDRIRPHVHRSMRQRLRARRMLGRQGVL